ncbi:MAG: respiratory nitrate reductase subunit beta [Gammaproteobacteria bacterium]|nr:respiratory nitrate reductase subunit beta [Gammaproteobacteria bacterium]
MRQIAMVMDLNKCIGCQTCTVACKFQWTNRESRDYMYWNNVETQPGKGYPSDWMEYEAGWDDEGQLKIGELPDLGDYGIPWEYNYAELLAGEADTLRPVLSEAEGSDENPVWGANWDEDVGSGDYPNSFFFYLPRICNHCTKPACLMACPNLAIRKREQDGIVLIDLTRCEGVRNCIRACPYKKIYFNPNKKYSISGAETKDIPGQSEKCILCFPRIEQGLPPACAKQCVGRIRHVGYLDDGESQVYKLVKKWQVALPLRPDFNTEPNVYYVPPLSPPQFNEQGEVTDEPRIPLAYLRKLFGAGVDDALKALQEEMEKKANGEESELVDILIAYKHQDMFRL